MMEGKLLAVAAADPKKQWMPLTLRADDISASLLAFADDEQLQLKWKTALTACDVATPVADDPQHGAIPQLDEKPHCFYVHSSLADGRDDWHFFSCPDDATKKSWIKTLQQIARDGPKRPRFTSLTGKDAPPFRFLARVVEARPHESGKHAEYVVTCHCEVDSRVAGRRLAKEWHVCHRFSEFEALHEALKSTLGEGIATLPFVKHRRDALRAWFGSSLDAAFLEERRLQLDAYIRRVCTLETAVDFFKPHASAHLKTFFSFDENCEDVVIILGLCIVCAYLIKEYRFYYLPESGAAILLGLIVGACARIFYPSRKEMEFLRFNKLLFYFLLLPPIIFEAGYSLHRKRFFSNFNTILLFAVLGTMVSTFIIGFLTFYAGKWGWITIDTSSPLEALLFGALISAVDPVATLSILGNPELNLDPLLYSLVFGESVLNDAVAIVLFNTFLKFYESQSEFTTGAIASLMVEFVFISLGSVACGVVTGLACSFTCKNTNIKGYPAYEITLLFLYAYGSYALAEVMKLSGIMSLFFCGITMAHYNSYNLSKESQVTAEHIFKSFALTAEFFVFLYMGMGFCAGQFGRWDVTNMPGPNQDVYVTTTLSVVVFTTLVCDVYVTTTLSVVVFTTLVCGGLTEPLLTYTQLKREGEDSHQGAYDEEEEYGLLHENVDERYLKPIFGGKSEHVSSA
ncbi:hypothetical protein P43SY_004091 [Pythium insidiosum]|uniref:Sodium/hydrogen exchanger n=1 Tax=Pythium insidiosum TaxID=114742 RepID=A0AAD5M0C8_PYTIN|nr:hypothetical protein P43SY_004091 [Pythium insidiosum]